MNADKSYRLRADADTTHDDESDIVDGYLDGSDEPTPEERERLEAVAGATIAKLEEAVAAYVADDFPGCVAALEAAAERENADWAVTASTDALRDRLLEEFPEKKTEEDADMERWDAAGVPHTLDAASLAAALRAYGAACKEAGAEPIAPDVDCLWTSVDGDAEVVVAAYAEVFGEFEADFLRMGLGIAPTQREIPKPLVDLPESLTAWSVLPEDQGQTIETAYAVDWESEDLWRQTTDQSYPVSDSRRVTYSVAPIESGEYEPQNGELPKVGTWRSVRVRATK